MAQLMNKRAELATIIDNFLPSFNTSHKLPNYKLRTLDIYKNAEQHIWVDI